MKKEKETKFKKEDFKKSKTFSKYIDVISVVLEDDEEITKDELSKRVQDLLEKEVK